MSNTVDKRVVEMRFDNDQFESRASKSLGTLEKLKQALNFKGASTGLDELGKSARGLDFNPLRSAVDGVQVSFSKMEAVALTALMNITNRVVDAGVAIAKNLTVDQLSSGWQKYADKTTAVQTIMAATKNQFTDTAEQMEYVNEQLEKLNWFTDETSYNFVDMVSNIGKFTSNGVKLDAAATAMQGIATWAAVSGQNAGVASNAMYQLAQALGTGAVKLQDWKSIENANMATYEFKEMALEAAVALGTVEKKADGTYRTIEKGNDVTIEGFRESLKEGWFTSDVLIKVLDQYGGFTNKLYEISDATGQTATDLLQWIEKYRDAGTDTTKIINDMAKETGLSVQEIQGYMEELTDQTYELGEKAFRAAQEAKTFGEAIDATKDAVSTGWMKTFEIIFGNYEEARVRWTALANELWDIFASGAEARNELLEEALGIPEGLVREQTAGWAAVEKAIEAAGIPLDDFIQKCLELGGRDGDAITSLEEFKNSLTEGWLTKDIVSEAIDSFIGPIEDANGMMETAGHTFEDFKRIVDETWHGDWGNWVPRWKEYTEAGWNWDAMQQAVNKSGKDLELTYEDYQAALMACSEEQLRYLGYTDAEIKSIQEAQKAYGEFDDVIYDVTDSTAGLRTGSELLFDGISKGWSAIKGVFGAIKEGWDLAFPPMTAERLYGILDSFNRLMNSFNDWVNKGTAMYSALGKVLNPDVPHTNLENITATFRGLADILGIVTDALKAAGRFLADTFGGQVGSAASRVLEFTGDIGRNITKLREWLQGNNVFYRSFSILKTAIEMGTTALKNWFNTFKQSEAVQARITAIKGWFTDIWNTVKATFPKTTTKINEIWSAIKNFSLFGDDAGLKLLIERIQGLGKSIKNDLLAQWEKLKKSNFFGGFASGIGNIWNAIKEHDPELLPNWLRKIYDVLHNLFQPVIDLFKEIKEKLSGAAKDVQSGVRTIGDVIGDGAIWLKNNVGKLIAAFAAIVIPVSIYKSVKNLANIAKIITSPFQAIADAITNLGSAMKGVNRILTVGALVGVVFAISMLADVILKLRGITWDEVKTGVAILAGISVVIGVLLGIIAAINKYKSKIDPKIIKKQSDGFLKILELAAALYLVVQAFADIYAVIKDGNAKAAIIAAVGVVGVLGVLIAALIGLNKFGDLSKLSGSSFLPIVGIGLTIKMMVGTFTELYDILKEPDWEALEASLEAFGAAVLGMLFMMAGLSHMASAGVTAGTGWSLVGAVGALRLMIEVMKEFTELDLSGISKHIGSAILVVGAFAGLMYAMSKMPPNRGGTGWGVLALALSIRVLVSAVKAVSDLDDSQAVRGTAVVAALIAFVGLFTYFVNGVYIPPATSLAMIALTVAIGILGAIVVALTLLCDDAQKLKDVSESLGIITGAVAALVFAMGEVSGWGFAILAGIAAAVAATALVAVIGGLLYLMVTNITYSDACEAQKIATAVLEVCGGIFLIAVAMVGVGALAEFAVAGGLIILVAIAAVSLITWALFEVAKHTSSESVEKLKEFLTGVGEAFGSVVSGALDAATSNIEAIGTRLSNFAKNAEGFFNLLKDEGMKSAAESAQQLAQAILTLTAADFINTIIQMLLGGDYDNFQTALEKFGGAMVSYCDIITGADGGNGIDSDAISQSATAGQAIADLVQKLQSTGGVWQWFSGEKDFDKFATGLTNYGKAIVGYNNEVKGTSFDHDAINDSVTAGEEINGITDYISATGGKWQELWGVADIENFASSVAAYGTAIKDYEDKMDGFVYHKLSTENSVTAGKEIAKLTEVIPYSGGLWQKLMGTKDLEAFGESIKAYATAVIEYNTTLNGYTYSLGGPTYAAYQTGYQLYQLVTLVTSNNSSTELINFGGSIETFGVKISTFYGSLSNVDTDRLSAITTAITTMCADISSVDLSQANAMLSSLQKLATDGIATFLEQFSSPDSVAISSAIDTFISAVIAALDAKESDFTKIGGDLAHAVSLEFGGEAQATYADLRATMLAEALLKALAGKQSDFETKGTESATAYLKKIQDQYSSAVTTGTVLATSVVYGADSMKSGKAGSFANAGSAAASAYISAIKNASGASSAGASLASSAVSGMSNYNGAVTAGGTVVSGFVAGVNNRNTRNAAYNAGHSIGAQALAGMRAALDSHSPSREAMKIGDNTGVGYVNALYKWAQKSYGAGEEVGMQALEGINLAIAKISDLIQNDVDINPIITPMVDLTGATRSIQKMNEMFNDSVSVATDNVAVTGSAFAASRVGVIGSMDRSSAQNDQNEDTGATNYYNTFNVTTNNPDEFVNYVSRKLKREVDRRGSQWA